MSRLQEIQERASAASKGPWHWSGNTDSRWLALSNWVPGAGRCNVMDFVRWGTQSDVDDLLAVIAAVEAVCDEYGPMTARNDEVRYGADAVLKAVRDALDGVG